MSNRLNSAPFGMFHLRTVLVSGMGFLCDSYDLLVIGIVFPMIALSYSLDNTSEAWIKSSATLGTLLGQLLFGWMGDRYKTSGWGWR